MAQCAPDFTPSALNFGLHQSLTSLRKIFWPTTSEAITKEEKSFRESLCACLRSEYVRGGLSVVGSKWNGALLVDYCSILRRALIFTTPLTHKFCSLLSNFDGGTYCDSMSFH